MKKNYMLDHSSGDRVFFTDGCNDLTREERFRYGIWPDVAPLSVTVNGENVDYSDIDDFYDKLKDGTYAPGSIRTACPSPETIERLLVDIINNTPDYVNVYYLGASPYISAGTFNAHRMVMAEFAERYPMRKFVCIDTTCASNGTALASQYIAASDAEDKDIELVAEDITKHTMHLFTQRELSFSAKSGRYNTFERIALGAMEKMKISPNMFFPREDKLSIAGIARGDTILNEWVNYFVQNRVDDDTTIRIAYGHHDEEARARKFVDKLKNAGAVRDEQIQYARVGSAIGAHTGPTVLSIFFLQRDDRPLSKNDYKKPAKN